MLACALRGILGNCNLLKDRTGQASYPSKIRQWQQEMVYRLSQFTLYWYGYEDHLWMNEDTIRSDTWVLEAQHPHHSSTSIKA